MLPTSTNWKRSCHIPIEQGATQPWDTAGRPLTPLGGSMEYRRDAALHLQVLSWPLKHASLASRKNPIQRLPQGVCFGPPGTTWPGPGLLPLKGLATHFDHLKATEGRFPQPGIPPATEKAAQVSRPFSRTNSSAWRGRAPGSWWGAGLVGALGYRS